MRLLHSNSIAPRVKARALRLGPDAAELSEAEIIYFDGTCGMCTGTARRLRRIVAPHGFALMPFQSCKDFTEVPDEMKLRTRDGRLLGGADAIVYICRRIWWAWPIWMMSFVPGVMALLRRSYRRVARNRHAISGACRIEP